MHPPSVDRLSRDPLLADFPEKVRVMAARMAIDHWRETARIPLPRVAAAIAKTLSKPTMERVINLSGVILHTGIGRARLADFAVERIQEVASRYSELELDPETRGRGDRQDHVRDLLCDLTGVEDALVVNNAAGAVLLALSALASGREVLLSRGEMVEIGGSFRMPDVVGQSGCLLIETGCTNKTRLSDFEERINDATAAILRCHTSNYRIVGFTSTPSIRETAELAKRSGVLLIHDQGTGCMIDLSRFGISTQMTLPDSVRAGADITIASGDKLLGATQAGIIVGRSGLISRLKHHPLARALRIDKLSLAGLEATLRLYRDGREMEIPTLRYLARPMTDIRRVADTLDEAWLGKSLIEQGFTEIGGGTSPGTGVPTWRVGIETDDPDLVAKKMLSAEVPVICRIEEGKVWLDPRTLDDDELPEVVECLNEISK